MCCMLASCCSSHIELVLTLCALFPGGTPSLSAMTGGESPAWMLLPLHKPFSAGLTELFLQHFEGFHSIRHFWVWWVCRRESMRSAFWSVCLWVGPFSLLLRCGCVCFQDSGGAACAWGGPADHHSGGGAEKTRQWAHHLRSTATTWNQVDQQHTGTLLVQQN